MATNNTTPDVSTAYPAITFIPVRTPFELTGTGTDIDGDDLTYSWDEIDIGPTSALGSPSGGAPIFRWFEPTTNPTRTFRVFLPLETMVTIKQRYCQLTTET